MRSMPIAGDSIQEKRSASLAAPGDRALPDEARASASARASSSSSVRASVRAGAGQSQEQEHDLI